MALISHIKIALESIGWIGWLLWKEKQTKCLLMIYPSINHMQTEESVLLGGQLMPKKQ